MATDVETTAIEASTRRSPSPSRKSGQSSPANSQKRSSSFKRKHSAEYKTEGVPRENEEVKAHDGIVDSAERSSLPPALPKGTSSVRVKNPSPQIPFVPQPAQTAAKVEREEGVTEVEKYCRQEEKVYPDISMKPEETNAWPELSDALTQHDGDQVDAHCQNIDTLLVLSGLFSAVVTTLIIEAYKQLQQDPADSTVQLLLQISMQLSSLSINPDFINSTYIPPPSLPFSPRRSAVLVNILWFTSLVLSLVTASLGMLIKQWLREYHSKSNVSPEQCCQVRLFRAPGLRKYKVAEIASFLPILLQLAFILFFVGLTLFARSIHASIATVVGVIVAIWLSFVVVTTLLPIISPSCPYKTPLLKSVFLRLRNFLARQRMRIKDLSIGPYFRFLPDPLFTEEISREMDMETKIKVLMDAYEIFPDIKSWDIVIRCIDLNSPLESLQMLSALVKQKHGSEITVESQLTGLFDQHQLRLLLKSMAACLRRASFVALQGGEFAWFNSTEIVHFVTLRRLYFAFKSSGRSDSALRNMVYQLTEDEHVFSVPHPPKFIGSYIRSQMGLSPDHFPWNIDFNQMWRIIRYTIVALDSPGAGSAFRCNTSLSHLLEICRIVFQCAGRTNQYYHERWEVEFSQFKARLVQSLQSISYPERDVNAKDAFRAQCALEMAIRLHEYCPRVIDESLLRALHECSVRMFNLQANEFYTRWYHDGKIKRRDNLPSTSDAPCNVPEADWEKVLRGEVEEYVGVDIRDDGKYGDEWYHEDLQSTCKQRIEFMWAFTPTWITARYSFPRILEEFEMELRT